MLARHIFSALAALLLAAPVLAQSETAFTYQGELRDGNAAADGLYNIDVTLWDAATGGNQLGPEIEFNAHPVTRGVFTLELDFADHMTLPITKWLEFSINGTELTPRTLISGTPFSIRTRGINVDSNDKVGLGTAAPEHELDIEAERPILRITATENNVSAYPSIRFKGSNGSPLFQSLGTIDFFDENDVHRALFSANKSGPTNSQFNFATIPGEVGQLAVYDDFIRVRDGIELSRRSDLASGAFIRGDGSDSYLQLLGGDIGVGTESPSAKLHAVTSSSNSQAIQGTVNTAGSFNTGVWGESTVTTGDGAGVQGRAASAEASAITAYNTSSNAGKGYGLFARSNALGGVGVFSWNANPSGGGIGVQGRTDSPAGFDFYADGAGMNYGASSSIRWKNNITPIQDPLARLAKLRGVTFDWNPDHGGHHDIGMIAEEVGLVLPEVVAYEPNGVDAIGIDYSKLTPLLVEALKELHTKSRNEINDLRAENADLRTRLEALEAFVYGAPQRPAADLQAKESNQ